MPLVPYTHQPVPALMFAICSSEMKLEGGSRWLNKALPLLTTRLPNVTSLKLDFRWNLLHGTEQAMMLSGFQKVTYLSLGSCWFDTFAEMNELIASFPLLEHLKCSHTYWSTNAGPMIPLPHNINKITLSADQSTEA
jgi:hypothetical protein